ncbi:CAZyme family GH13 [Penicillium maclennaniae]|uniref:CAZyme family GH13 n=1 Tax=Penicillium maclennaniae TaxID=1343394 RepID=UPI00253FA510|nr:CAZyme family GH13 [Penicillium maclennaniae]KAJ5682033.1 CAZyme family GH13 [Penicillium maclennaniae]
MVSFFSCFSGSRRRERQILAKREEAAQNLDQLPSWTAPDNKLILQAFEWHVPADHRHWLRLKAALPEWKSIGVDQIWIPPGCKGMDPRGNGYDIYDLFDLGEFDQQGAISTKWGTRKELEELIRQAHDLGIGVIWDAVLNHKAGAEYSESFNAVAVDPKQRNKEISKLLEIHGWTGFDFPGRGEMYSAMKYHWQHFSGVDWDDKGKKQQIYKILGPNKDWAPDVSDEIGNYDYLMFADLDHSHPDVREDLLYWGTWITNSLSLSGMRLDAAKHFSMRFQKAFVEHVRKTANPNFVVLSEYWTGDLSAIHDYLEKVDYQTLAYDVPLLIKFSELSHTRSPDLRGIFDGTLVQTTPDNAVTFVANHDTQVGQMLETPVASSFKLLAYALILLRKGGQPCIFYGDVYGIRANVEVPMTPACDGKLPILSQARRRYAYGEQEDYFDQANCIGFVRYGNAYHPGLACVLSSGGPSKKRMFIGRQYASTEWVDILGYHDTAVHIDKRGYGNFPVKAVSVSVWVSAVAVEQDNLQRDLYVENLPPSSKWLYRTTAEHRGHVGKRTANPGVGEVH